MPPPPCGEGRGGGRRCLPRWPPTPPPTPPHERGGEPLSRPEPPRLLTSNRNEGFMAVPNA
ncbi:hypothetical protein MTBUT4_240044 [Magnetospirillum sp. UT-4]|nr:hypothetical protein MTBUT4_240044 [Magnetospirillum sp. UT-4]